MSTTKFEYRALHEAAKDIVFLCQLLAELSLCKKRATLLPSDNHSYETSSKYYYACQNKAYRSSTSFYKERGEPRDLQVIYKPTDKQAVECLTKPLYIVKFTMNCKIFGIVEFPTPSDVEGARRGVRRNTPRNHDVVVTLLCSSR